MYQLITLVAAVLFCAAILSSIEAAIFTVTLSRAKLLQKQKKIGSSALVKIKEKISRPIIILVIMTNITSIVGSMFVGLYATEIFGDAWLGIFSALMTFLIIIFGEIIPKTIGENYSEKIAIVFAHPILGLIKVFFPVIWFFEKITDKLTVKRKIISEEELEMLSHIGHIEGSIEEDERDMISRVFTLNDLTAREIMTPRTVIEALPAEFKLKDLEEDIYKKSHSRLPVYIKDLDNILGVCHRSDLLRALAEDKKEIMVTEFMRPVITVLDNAKADELLPLFQKERRHIAIVKDKFGVTAGIVTLEDVLEQLVGEIVDEKDRFVSMRKQALIKEAEKIS